MVSSLRAIGTCSNQGIRSNTANPLTLTTCRPLILRTTRNRKTSRLCKSRLLPALLALGPKRYDYQCNCGYGFKSTIPPQLIKCPDCMGKPKIVEEVKGEE